MSDKAKLFTIGRTQAVRLPKAYRFEGEEVWIRQMEMSSCLASRLTGAGFSISTKRPLFPRISRARRIGRRAGTIAIHSPENDGAPVHARHERGMIAAHAKAEHATLVSRDKAFARLGHRISLENWMPDGSD